MTEKKIELNYDPDSDLLEIFIGSPVPAYYDEIGEDLFEGHNKETGELTGYKIFNLSKRKKEWIKSIKISLPANVIIS
ncbi:MAG: hypothetical protein KKC19_04280 [Nanoarchaeota archaeon]|nr:hypothetical protein [Nanoarchaeota archaeon]